MGMENVQYDLVFVCELKLGRDIIEGLFFLLSMGESMCEDDRGSVSP